MSNYRVPETGFADLGLVARQRAHEVVEREREVGQRAAAGRVSWRRILNVGLLLYLIGLVTFVLTATPTLFPALMLLGGFLVPVTYVAFFYQHRHLSSVSLPTVAQAFVYGGFLGAFAATLVESGYFSGLQAASLTAASLALLTYVGAGLIEEAAKLLGVLVVARRARHDAEVDGIILGAAAGMGFAALESCGYVFAAYVTSRGSLSEALAVTALRGVLAPLGHGTWTAIVASVLFRETRRGRFRVDPAVVGAYLVAALLHALWDGTVPVVGLLHLPPVWSLLAALLVFPVIGTLGLIVLWLRWREAARRQLADAAVDPNVGLLAAM
jgi:RsiW-degrading membrane proteinase PrsW (M82 family)